MNLYLESGYLDMASIIESGYPFIFLPAARGTGKTYGDLKYHIEHGNRILLIRSDPPVMGPYGSGRKAEK